MPRSEEVKGGICGYCGEPHRSPGLAYHMCRGYVRCSVCETILYKEDIRVYLGGYTLCKDCLRTALAHLGQIQRNRRKNSLKGRLRHDRQKKAQGIK